MFLEGLGELSEMVPLLTQRDAISAIDGHLNTQQAHRDGWQPTLLYIYIYIY